eukprot:gene15812-biopygen4129
MGPSQPSSRAQVSDDARRDGGAGAVPSAACLGGTPGDTSMGEGGKQLDRVSLRQADASTGAEAAERRAGVERRRRAPANAQRFEP